MNARRTFVTASLASAALMLAACGGHSSSVIPGTSTGGKGAMANFVITIPPKSVSSNSAKPHYISPNTQSATISVAGQTVTANLTATSAGCSTPAGGSLTCTVAVPAPAGSDTFTVTLFDAANGTGNQLSTGTVTATINAGATNNVPVTLNGVVASVAISLGNTAPYVGSAVSIPVTITAKDASGATIIGPGNYSPAIALTDSDASGHTTLSTSSVTAPGASVTLSYDGSGAVTAATISATASGTIKTVTSATLRPQNQTGSGGVSVATIGNTTYAEVPTAAGLLQVALGSNGQIQSVGRHPAARPMASSSPSPAPSASPLVLTPAPDACSVAPNGSKIYAYCVSFALTPQVINVVDLTSGTPTLVNTVTTDATTGPVSWSGGNCYICGISWDPKDNAVLISTANGYEFYDPSTGKQVRTTIPVPIAENFGYNPATNQIWSPNYTEADLVDVALGAWYKDADYSSPYIDSGAVDSSTNVAVSLDEGGTTSYVVPLSGAVLSTPAPTASAPGTLTDPIASTPSFATDSGCESTAISIDSTAHVAFISGEFSSPDCFGAVQLPSTTPTAAVTPSNYVWVPAMPNTPDGNTFASAYDPHVAATFYLPGDPDLLGVAFNFTRSYVAVVDLTKLLALAGTSAMSSGDPHQVAASYDLIANGILTYIPTGYTGGPASNAFIRRPAMRRR